jgi:hypothetical protein
MTALAFWKAMVADKSGFLERIIALLESAGFPYCVIGGVAVNAYAPTMVTQDLDIVLAPDDVARARALLSEHFKVQEFEHSINVYDPGSKLQVQIQKDPELGLIIGNARRLDVDDMDLPVAAPEDLFRLKVAAAMEPTRRNMKRGKDKMDLARLITEFPGLRALLPEELVEDVTKLLDAP